MRLATTPPSDIRAAFSAAVARSAAVPRDLRWFGSVTSTMDVAEEAVNAGAAENLVIVADEQTMGRGRRGRTWSSPPGAGLYLSFVFHSRSTPAAGGGSLLTLAAGVAVRTAITRATGLAPQLKWPNDVMVSRRKLAGILAEGLAVGTPAATIVLGIGINILGASHEGDIAARATSLEDELSRRVDRASVLEEVLVAVSDARDDVSRGNTSDILRQWRDAAPSAQGAAVEWRAQSGTQRGTTAGIDDTGALLVRTPTGVERIVGGEVIWV
jgi:BirA family transcriptional regulator, biotin operon repressor / biotin---[acetyl-CoA-carboxylase] ligase